MLISAVNYAYCMAQKLNSMNRRTLKARLKVVRRALSQSSADCLVVTKPANVTYLTGFTGDDSWAVVFPRTGALITDGRFTEQAARQCRLCSIIERKKSMVEAVAKLLQTRSAGRTPAVEKSTSVADFQELSKQLKSRLKTVALIVESARRTKDKDEIAAVRAAAEIAASAFERTRRLVRPGLSENELAGILDFQIRKLGGKNSFETIVAFGANASRPHHQPTDKKLSRNDTVLIDFGVRYNGYCCDITRCFEVGRANPLFRRTYIAAEQAQSAALNLVRAGAEITAVDRAARDVINKSGLPVYSHGTGHGLGLEVHELPVVSNRTKEKLLAGDVITIEPAVYLPGRLGVRLEDDVLVTDYGYILLTAGTKKKR